MTAFDSLVAHERTTWSLAQVMGRLGWDQETTMPRGAAEQRGEESAALVIRASSLPSCALAERRMLDFDPCCPPPEASGSHSPRFARMASL